jgi:hypothetical protein
MLKHGEVNPLNVFGLREVVNCPPHFEKVQFDLRVSSKQITDWIYENFESRFWFGDVYYSSESGSVVMSACAAFESAAEASYFALILDQINSSTDNYLS